MDITRTPETRHIGINKEALKAFLLEQGFAPAFLDELNLIVAPVSCENEVDDAALEELNIGWANAWVYAKNASIKLMNRQLLAAIRMQVYDCEQLDSAEETLKNWNVDPLTLTLNEIADDCLRFAHNYPAQQFVSLDDAHYPLFETDRRCPGHLLAVPQQLYTTPSPVNVHPIISTSIALCTLAAVCVVIGRVPWGLVKEIVS